MAIHWAVMASDGQCTVDSMYNVCYYQWDPNVHKLSVSVVDESGDIERDVIHPPSCKSTTAYPFGDDIPYTHYDCGLDGILADDIWSTDGEGEYNVPGIYLIEVWSGKSWTDYGWEHDGKVYLFPLEIYVGTLNCKATSEQ